MILGLLLFGAVPTALFYWILFALGRWLLSLAIPKPWWLPSLWLALLIGVLVPLYGDARTAAAYRSAVRTDVVPDRGIELAGDIRLDFTEHYDWQVPFDPSEYRNPVAGDEAAREGRHAEASSCGAVCRALLATPGVTSVTVDGQHKVLFPNPSIHAVTYRADRDCMTNATRSHDYLDYEPGDMAKLDQAQCVSGGRPISRFDYHIVQTLGTTEPQARVTGRGDVETNLLKRPLYLPRLEVFDASGRALFRWSIVSMRVVMVPLIVLPSLAEHGPHLGFFAWDKRNRPWRNAPSVVDLLLAHTNIAGTVAPVQVRS